MEPFRHLTLNTKFRTKICNATKTEAEDRLACFTQEKAEKWLSTSSNRPHILFFAGFHRPQKVELTPVKIFRQVDRTKGSGNVPHLTTQDDG